MQCLSDLEECCQDIHTEGWMQTAGTLPEELRTRCCEVIDALYDTFVECTPMPNITATKRLEYAMNLMGGGLLALDTIDQRYEGMRDQYARFRAILMHPHIGLMTPRIVRNNGAQGDVIVDNMRAHVTLKMDKIKDAMYTQYMFTRCEAQMRCIPTQLQGTTSLSSTIPADKMESQHILNEWALTKLHAYNARRLDNWVMFPRYSPEGYFTNTWTQFCEIDEFLGCSIHKDFDTDIYLIWSGKETRGKTTNNFLTNNFHPEFPDLRRKSPWLKQKEGRNRLMFAFANGIYDGSRHVFVPYGHKHRRNNTTPSDDNNDDTYRNQIYALQQKEQLRQQQLKDALEVFDFETEQLDPDHENMYPLNDDAMIDPDIEAIFAGTREGIIDDRAAANYHNHVLPIQETMSCRDPMDIQTEVLDNMFKAQGYSWDRVEPDDKTSDMLIMWAMIGRMLRNCGQDNLQLVPFMKGAAGSGKSTLIMVVKAMYHLVDVGILGNNAQETFSLESVANKFMVLIPEMRGDFTTDQAAMQSIIACEDVTINRKHKKALIVEWDTPMMIAGNMTANWHDTQGSLARRFLFLPFPISIPPDQVDTNLLRKIKEILPSIIVKANLAYKKLMHIIKKHGGDLWNVVPKRLMDERRKFASRANTLQHFLEGGECELAPKDMDVKTCCEEGFYWRWNGSSNSFANTYRNQMRETNAMAVDLSNEDMYASTLHKMNITLSLEELEDPVTGNPATHMWAIGVRPRSEAGNFTNQNNNHQQRRTAPPPPPSQEFEE